jgi:dCMP deaminase
MTAEDRISRDVMFMVMAIAAAARSTCRRLQVGCVITNMQGTKILGIGYNGNAAGLSNQCDSSEPGACGCIHAEVNALLKAPYENNQLILYTTYSPCLACAKLILNSQVTRVVYLEQYRKDEGIQLLRGHGVICNTLDTTIDVDIRVCRPNDMLTMGFTARSIQLEPQPELDTMSSPVMTRDGRIR